MNENKELEPIKDLIKKANQEINSFTGEELDLFLGGVSNRGLDAIAERWYGPMRFKNNSALYTLGEIIFEIKYFLDSALENAEWEE